MPKNRQITTPARFRRWLQSEAASRLEFLPGIACLCPLGQYSGQPVFLTDYGDGTLPEWAKLFVLKWDRTKHGRTARSALSVLDKVIKLMRSYA